MSNPVYNPGHVFTAAQLNQYIVEDDGAKLAALQASITFQIEQIDLTLPPAIQALQPQLNSIQARQNALANKLTQMEALWV